MTWQPIDTAPFNRLVLVAGVRDGRHVVGIAKQWEAADIAATRDRTAWTGCRFEPTHWMPLPEPPKP